MLILCSLEAGIAIQKTKTHLSSPVSNMNALRKNLPDHLRFLVWVHLILLVVFTVFRGVTLLVNRPTYVSSVETSPNVWEAFQVGFKFDVLVASYALLVPYLILTAAFIWDWTHPRWFRFVRVYCTTAIIVSLIICAADVPYFNFFNSRLTVAAVNWKNLGQVVKYIVREVKYYPFIVVGLLGIWGIGKIVRNLWNRSETEYDHTMPRKITYSSLAFVLLLIGLWGGATPQAPNMKSACFSTDGFINQLTLNPVHTWFDSYFDFDINFLPLETAKQKVKNYFSSGHGNHESPLAKQRDFRDAGRRMNVVLILMESMSANRMGIFGDPKNLTPGLDSICRNSIFFDRAYSNGIHTNAGIYSTLYGMPIMMMQHPMNNGRSELTQFTGLPVTLRDLGYETAFFCTHAKTFDNLDVFLEKNGFNIISDITDYPDSVVANSWGVADETLFEHARQRLNHLAADSTGKPFFATILTITAHPPYTYPAFSKFKPRSTDQVEQCYEYADWAVKNFMDSVAQEDWFKNTIFVMVGDHGSNIPGPYEVPLSYNHVPLIIVAPGLFRRPETRHSLANQTDIFPTVMGLLQQDYVQNTTGYDLFREKRPFAIFSQDLKMGVINDRYLYIARKSGKETLYEFKTAFGVDILKRNRALADSMKTFACSQLQVTQWMIENKLTGAAGK